jgi:hypothetical protein
VRACVRADVCAPQMVGYVRAELHRLESLPADDFLACRWRFGAPLGLPQPPPRDPAPPSSSA